MVVTILNASPSEAAAQVLLSRHLHAFSDVDIIAGQKHYPAHRAVLAVHSIDFRHAFSNPPPPAPPRTPSQKHLQHLTPPPTASHAPPPPPRYRIHISVDDASDHALRRGWQLVYSYMYGATIPLDTDAVLFALPICRRYRFDQLAEVLDAFLCDAAVDARNCTRVYTAAIARAAHDADAQLVVRAAWMVMKMQFETVSDWMCISYPAFVHLLKLNDLATRSEMAVFRAAERWVLGNVPDIKEDMVMGVLKLVRFPTMTSAELEEVMSSRVLRQFPACRKYVNRGLAARADERRGVVRSVVMENSPVYRRRRTDALTFSDRVAQWSSVQKSVHTSSRYFAGCLWNLIIEVRGEWMGLHLGCMSENEERDVDVELDFSVFVVRHVGGEPLLVTKEVKGACFGRSGQRIGFARMMERDLLLKEEERFLVRNTLFVGASIRLRCSRQEVVGISKHGDDTVESECILV